MRLDTNAFDERPEIAIAVAKSIASWSTVEAALANLFVTRVSSNKEIGASLWNGFSSATVKKESIRALCAATASKEDYTIVLAAIRMVSAYGKVRDKLAHWIWGWIDDVADGMILIDPKTLLLKDGQIADAVAEAITTGSRGISVPLGIPDDKIYIYRKEDGQIDIRDFKRTREIIVKLTYLLRAEGTERDALRAELTTHAHLEPFLSP